MQSIHTEHNVKLIGIDLGSVTTCLAELVDNEPKLIIIENEKTIPTAVTYNPKTWQPEIGRSQLLKHPKFQFPEFRNFLGCTPNDPRLQKMLKYQPYNTVQIGNALHLEIHEGDYTIVRKPEDILYDFLWCLRRHIVGHNLCTVKAIVSIPHWFSRLQRKLLKKCMQHANIHLINVCYESIAAINTYFHYSRPNVPIVVIDFGGSSFGISLITAQNVKYQVTLYETCEISGKLLDTIVFDHLQKCNRSSKNPFDEQSLQKIANEVKETLSSLAQLGNTKKDPIFLTRNEFEALIQSTMKYLMHFVEQFMKKVVKLNTHYNVVLVGASSKVPIYRRLLNAHLKSAGIILDNFPDEVVAKGAALIAQELHNTKYQKYEFKALRRNTFEACNRYLTLIDMRGLTSESCYRFLDTFKDLEWDEEEKLAQLLKVYLELLESADSNAQELAQMLRGLWEQYLDTYL